MGSGFFPGFLDSDGRPWELFSTSPSNYQKGLESALKIALLTHRHLLIPAGYFLDNPHIQRIFLKYKGETNESKCFRALMRDLLRISPNELTTFAPDGTCDWNETYRHWIDGDGTNRARPVYLNCVNHGVATEIQQSPTTDVFVRQMNLALIAEWGVDLSEFLQLCNSMKLSCVAHGPFEFNSLIRSKLLTGNETFFEFRDDISAKVQAIAEAAMNSGMRLSRSLLCNSHLCMDIGVKTYQTLTPAEYQSIAPVLGHYHHIAFSRSLGVEGIATYRLPRPDQTAKQLLMEKITDIAAVARGGVSPCLSWPLSSITFENLWQLRIRRTDFQDSLNSVYDAAKASSIDEYQQALSKYSRYVAGVIGFDFSDPNPEDLAAGLDGTVFADTTASAGAMLGVAKYAFTFCRDFFPNIAKELQVRCMFRRISQNSDAPL